ncbi:MAG: 50S ribosomal protein L17 [Elusimicrobiota bacterium]
MNINQKRKIKILTYQLIKKGRVTTTVPAAKEVRKKAERLITRSRKDSVSNRRYASGILPKDGMKRLFDVIGPASAGRNGGYTRLLRLGKNRKGDGAELCILEIIDV